MKGRVVAAGAFHLHTQKRLTNQLRLCGHRHIILCGHTKARRTPIVTAPVHHHQLGDKAIHWLIVLQAFVNPKTKWTGVVELRFENVRVFRKDILPVARPLIGPSTGIFQHPLNCPRAPAFFLVTLKLFNYLWRRHYAIGVQRSTPEKGPIISQGCRSPPRRLQPGVDEMVDGVVCGKVGGALLL